MIAAAIAVVSLNLSLLLASATTTAVAAFQINRHCDSDSRVSSYSAGSCSFSRRASSFAGTVLHAQTSKDDSSSSSESSPIINGGGGLVAQQQQVDAVVKTQLFSAFTNLGVADQYDAVLTGLCAKILDGNNDNAAASSTKASTDTQGATASSLLQDCTDLLQEMNDQKIAASPRSLMALIDVCTTLYSVLAMLLFVVR